MKFLVAFIATLAVTTAAPNSQQSAYFSTYRYVTAPQADINVLPSGYLTDTPEVAQAKAAHLAELSKASNSPSQTYYTAPAQSYYAPTRQSYVPSQITVLPSGYLADTPEVAQAKAVHYAELARASGNPTQTYYTAPTQSYYAPKYESYAPAQITVLPSGYLADTPEVAQAKSAHLAELAKASGSSTQAYYTAPDQSYYAPTSQSYTPSQITVLPSGYLADTPEVAQAKSAHLSELAKASGSPSQTYYTASTKSYYAPTSQSYTPSQITVLPSGYLADTPEVAQAKSAHLSEVAKASYNPSQAYYTASQSYYAPTSQSYVPSQITVLPSGYLADTPEVAQAKSAHLVELARAAYYSRSN